MNNKKYMLDPTDSIQFRGKTLYRIIALNEIMLKYKGYPYNKVLEGDKGGYVESEANLSHEGSCWILDDAKVLDNAVVSGDAVVEHKARVFGNARVEDNATISGRAKVYGKAEIRGFSNISGKASVSGWSVILRYSNISDNATVRCKGAYLYDIHICDNALIQHIADYFSIHGVCSVCRGIYVFREKNGWKVDCGYFKGTIDEFEKELKEKHKFYKKTEYNKELIKVDLAMIKLIKSRIMAREKVQPLE